MEDGLAGAIANTFDISVVVWIAFFVSVRLLLRAPRQPADRADLIASACALVAIMLPIGPLSWVGLTGLALYILDRSFRTRDEQLLPACRAAWIVLATTGAMFWDHILMHVMSGAILDADAVLVGWFTGMERMGNTVRFADGSDFIWIAEKCSSLANIWLAILCWVLFMQYRGIRWSWPGAGWCLLACVTMVAINVTRMGLIVLYHHQFEAIHGPVGAAVASWLSVVTVLAICMVGTRRGHFSSV